MKFKMHHNYTTLRSVKNTDNNVVTFIMPKTSSSTILMMYILPNYGPIAGGTKQIIPINPSGG
jgi:hypothetical protein